MLSWSGLECLKTQKPSTITTTKNENKSCDILKSFSIKIKLN